MNSKTEKKKKKSHQNAEEMMEKQISLLLITIEIVPFCYITECEQCREQKTDLMGGHRAICKSNVLTDLPLEIVGKNFCFKTLIFHLCTEKDLCPRYTTINVINLICFCYLPVMVMGTSLVNQPRAS